MTEKIRNICRSVFMPNNVNRITKLILIVLAVIITAKTLIFLKVCIFWNYPLDWRESAGILPTALLINGGNPFSIENQPQFLYGYGILYTWFAYPLALLFGPTLTLHRILSVLYLIFSCIILFWIFRLEKIEKFTALIGIVIFFTLHATTFTITSRPESLGMLLLLLSIFIVIKLRYSPTSLLLCGFFSILAFLTKPYFVLAAPGMAIYLFLFRSKKQGIYFAGGFIVALAICITLISTFNEAYITNVILLNLNAHQSDISRLIYEIPTILLLHIGLVILLCWKAILFMSSDRRQRIYFALSAIISSIIVLIVWKYSNATYDIFKASYPILTSLLDDLWYVITISFIILMASGVFSKYFRELSLATVTVRLNQPLFSGTKIKSTTFLIFFIIFLFLLGIYGFLKQDMIIKIIRLLIPTLFFDKIGRIMTIAGIILITSCTLYKGYRVRSLPKFTISLDQPMLSGIEIKLPTFMLWFTAIAMIFSFGQHSGGHIVYYYELLTPFLLCTALTIMDSFKVRTLLVSIPLLANLIILYLYFLPGLPSFSKESTTPWLKIETIISEHKNIYATAPFGHILYAQGKPVFDSGHTEYYGYGIKNNKSLIGEQYKKRCETFYKQIHNSIEKRAFDLMIIRAYIDIDRKNLETNYILKNKIILNTILWGDANIDVWEPKTFLSD